VIALWREVVIDSKRSSSSMEVLLGLLAIESMSGYELGMTIRRSVGHFWNESYGQIYPNLKKLAGGGFVTCRTERQKGKPDRPIYSITEKGRERLTEWPAVPPQPEIPRNELLLKLFFGEQVPKDSHTPCQNLYRSPFTRESTLRKRPRATGAGLSLDPKHCCAASSLIYAQQ
jgi:DNA-binding PadR family transcriptional regulator